MKDRLIRYFISCGALWSACSMWYDLHEIYATSKTNGSFLFGPPDSLARIALEMAEDARDHLGVSFAEPIEDFADQWTPEWINVLSLYSRQGVSTIFESDPFGGIQYLYFGFLSRVVRRFYLLAMELGDYKFNHKPKYDHILQIAEELDRKLAQFEAKATSDETVEQLQHLRRACASTVVQLWEDGVARGKLNV